jgi:chromosome partitioning protein
VELRAGLVTAAKAYLPVQASQFDIWTLDHLDELVALAQGVNPTLQTFVVLTRVSPNPLVAEVAEAKALLADTVIYDRIAYRRAAREGKAVHELVPPDRKASAECAFFYEEVFDAP